MANDQVNSVGVKAREFESDFKELPENSRLDYLLELADELPPLPEEYSDHPDLLERVEECQSPYFSLLK